LEFFVEHLPLGPLALCLAALPALAQATPDPDKGLELDRIGITAKRQTEPASSAQALTESAKLSAEIITREDIEAIRPRDFYDLFSRVAGAATTYQGRKYMNFLSMRGGDGNAVAILLDGFYIPSAQASRILAQFPMDTVESVKVVRNSTSLTLGPILDLGTSSIGANQGCVIITTRKGSAKETGFALQSGTYNSTEAQLYHADRIGAFSYRVAGTLSGSDGRTGWYTEQQSNSLLANAGYEGETLKLRGTLYFMHGMRDMEHSFTNTTNKSYWGYEPMHSLWMAFSADKLWSASEVTSFAYSHGFLADTEVMNAASAANNPATVTTTRTHQTDFTDNAHLWHTAALGRHTLKVGVQGTWWDEPNGYASWDGKSRTETMLGAYAEDQQRVGQRLSLDYGVRFDRKHFDEILSAGAAAKVAWTSQFASTVGAAYELGKLHTLTGQWGYSHAPSDPFLPMASGKVLQPENRYKYEAGVEGRYHPAFNPKLTVYYYAIHNYKWSITQGTGAGTQVYDTVSEVTRRGYELSSHGSLAWGLGYHATYSHASLSQATVSRSIPHDTGSATLSYTQGVFQLNGSVNRVGPFESNSFTASSTTYVPVGNYTRYDANGSAGFRNGAFQGRVTLYGQNLSDSHYQTVNGFPDQGRTYGVRFEGRF